LGFRKEAESRVIHARCGSRHHPPGVRPGFCAESGVHAGRHNPVSGGYYPTGRVGALQPLTLLARGGAPHGQDAPSGIGSPVAGYNPDRALRSLAPALPTQGRSVSKAVSKSMSKTWHRGSVALGSGELAHLHAERIRAGVRVLV